MNFNLISLRAIRRDLTLTQEQVGNMVGLDQRTVSSAELGTSHASEMTRVNILNTLRSEAKTYDGLLNKGRPTVQTRNISRSLTRAMKALGLNQRQVADLVGVNYRTVNQYVNGRNNAPETFITVFQHYFNVVL
jgi:transcriptional regulator with XRE-family HTH domain